MRLIFKTYVIFFSCQTCGAGHAGYAAGDWLVVPGASRDMYICARLRLLWRNRQVQLHACFPREGNKHPNLANQTVGGGPEQSADPSERRIPAVTCSARCSFSVQLETRVSGWQPQIDRPLIATASSPKLAYLQGFNWYLLSELGVNCL